MPYVRSHNKKPQTSAINPRGVQPYKTASAMLHGEFTARAVNILIPHLSISTITRRGNTGKLQMLPWCMAIPNNPAPFRHPFDINAIVTESLRYHSETTVLPTKELFFAAYYYGSQETYDKLFLDTKPGEYPGGDDPRVLEVVRIKPQFCDHRFVGHVYRPASAAFKKIQIWDPLFAWLGDGAKPRLQEFVRRKIITSVSEPDDPKTQTPW